MKYETLNKIQLLEKIAQLEQELEINYVGVREKDQIIASKDVEKSEALELKNAEILKLNAQIKALEEHISRMEKEAQYVVEQEVQKVHTHYTQLREQVQAVRTDCENTNKGILVFYDILEGVKKIKNLQNEVLDTLIVNVQKTYLDIEEEKEGN